jgi:hypothetical protein
LVEPPDQHRDVKAIVYPPEWHALAEVGVLGRDKQNLHPVSWVVCEVPPQHDAGDVLGGSEPH